MTAMSERMEKKRKEEERLDRKRNAKKRKRFDDVKDIRTKFGDEKVHRFVQFNKDQCGKYLQYKKKGKEHGKMPDDLEERRARCILWLDRPSPTPSFDDGDTPDSDVDAAVDNNDDANQDEVDADAEELFGVKDDADPSMAAM